jgi:hypothetical protein
MSLKTVTLRSRKVISNSLGKKVVKGGKVAREKNIIIKVYLTLALVETSIKARFIGWVVVKPGTLIKELRITIKRVRLVKKYI